MSNITPKNAEAVPRRNSKKEEIKQQATLVMQPDHSRERLAESETFFSIPFAPNMNVAISMAAGANARISIIGVVSLGSAGRSGSLFISEIRHGAIRPVPEQPTKATMNALNTKKNGTRKKPVANRAPSFSIRRTSPMLATTLQIRSTTSRSGIIPWPGFFIWRQAIPITLGANPANSQIAMRTDSASSSAGGSGRLCSSFIIPDHCVLPSAKPE